MPIDCALPGAMRHDPVGRAADCVVGGERDWRMDLARPFCVVRVLLLLRGPIEASTVAARLEGEAWGAAEFAFCYELSADRDGVDAALEAQRAMTEALRQVFGQGAEKIPVFAVCNRPGERVEDYARAWGATVVRA